MSIYEWKEDVALTCTEILFNHENEGNPTIWDTVMAFEGIMLSEMNQTKGNIAWNHLYMGLVDQHKAEPIETVEKWLPGAAR